MQLFYSHSPPLFLPAFSVGGLLFEEGAYSKNLDVPVAKKNDTATNANAEAKNTVRIFSSRRESSVVTHWAAPSASPLAVVDQNDASACRL